MRRKAGWSSVLPFPQPSRYQHPPAPHHINLLLCLQYVGTIWSVSVCLRSDNTMCWSLFLVVSVLYVVCLVTRYLLTPAHTKPPNPHLSSFSFSCSCSFSLRLDWSHFRCGVVDVSKLSKSIHSIHYQQSRPDHGSLSAASEIE